MKPLLQEFPSIRPVVDAPKRKLLLVDENMADLLYYSAILQHLAYEVRSCASYTDAANIFAREDFDLIIIAQGGSSFEGRTVLSRAVEAYGHTPVLVLARNVDIDSYIEAMQMGAYDYLEKPLAPSEVAALVADCIRNAWA